MLLPAAAVVVAGTGGQQRRRRRRTQQPLWPLLPVEQLLASSFLSLAGMNRDSSGLDHFLQFLILQSRGNTNFGVLYTFGFLE